MYGDAVFEAAGTLRRLYEEVDWSATSLGPVSSWSPALRGALDLALHTRFPVTLFWGSDLVLLYNEAFPALIADKHPAALGRPAPDVFPEAWQAIGPLMKGVMAGDGPTWTEDARVPLQRHGRLEEAYFTFSYSPVHEADGTVGGVLDIATETTRQVIDRRRLTTLSRLREVLGESDNVEAVRERALSVLRDNPADLPTVDIHVGFAANPDDGPLRSHDSETVEASGAGRVARFQLGSSPDEATSPWLEVRLSDHLAPDETYLGFLRLIAAALGQAIDRARARDVERAVSAAERSVSEALQRSLLTKPSLPDGIQVAVRYRPAAEQVEVGGDWYDAFLTSDGALTAVVGDVNGHDVKAIAAMAQVRNLLRGICHATHHTPAEVLSSLDQAMRGLAIGTYATALLARIEPARPDAKSPPRTLRWSNAGHPPPVLLGPDGEAHLLEAPPDALLGVGDGKRADQAISINPGSSVVLYTDGLIERRTSPLQERLEWLTGILAGRQALSAEELCDHLLGQLDDSVEDDIALLVLRT